MVAVGDGDGQEGDVEFPAVGQGQGPRAVPAGWSRVVAGGEGGAVPAAAAGCWFPFSFAGGPGAAVADRGPGGVGDGDAPGAVGAAAAARPGRGRVGGRSGRVRD